MESVNKKHPECTNPNCVGGFVHDPKLRNPYYCYICRGHNFLDGLENNTLRKQGISKKCLNLYQKKYKHPKGSEEYNKYANLEKISLFTYHTAGGDILFKRYLLARMVYYVVKGLTENPPKALDSQFPFEYVFWRDVVEASFKPEGENDEWEVYNTTPFLAVVLPTGHNNEGFRKNFNDLILGRLSKGLTTWLYYPQLKGMVLNPYDTSVDSNFETGHGMDLINILNEHGTLVHMRHDPVEDEKESV